MHFEICLQGCTRAPLSSMPIGEDGLFMSVIYAILTFQKTKYFADYRTQKAKAGGGLR